MASSKSRRSSRARTSTRPACRPRRSSSSKLEDGVRLHESVKVELETYARENGERIVKPFVLVIARDTTHAAELMQLIKSDGFFEGRYADKVIQVDSSVKEEETVERLLTVEHTDEPTEIVIHVNMLKEGWDVTNLYTIVPLRAANARTLIEQSIGRGLRLPYGKRTGVTAVDRLNIVAHDRFQEIVDEANKPDSPIRLQQVILSNRAAAAEDGHCRLATSACRELGMQSDGAAPSTASGFHEAQSVFNAEEQKIAQIAYDVIRKFESSAAQVAERCHPHQARGSGSGSSRGGEPLSASADGIGRNR